MAIKASFGNIQKATAANGGFVPAVDVDESAADKLANELGVGAAAEAAEVTEPATTAVITRSAPSAVTAYRDVSDGGIEGEFDESDFRPPQLKIVNGSGELARQYNQGALLYAGQLLWQPPMANTPTKTMKIVPVKITKQWRENLTPEEVADELMPRIVDTREEAERLGGPGSTRWQGDQKPRWSPSARCLFLLQEPDNCDHPGFTSTLDGKNWGPAVFYASGMAYNESAKQIFNTAQISLRGADRKICLYKRIWTFAVERSKGGKFTVFIPKLTLTREETGPELRDMAARIGGAVVTADAE